MSSGLYRNIMLVEEKEYGKVFKFEVGPIKVTKKIYKPTVKRFEKWLNIVEKEDYFSKFDFLLTGSFPNYINNTLTWQTWDIDIILIDDSENSLEDIRDTLVHCARVALEECDFYLDIYYQNREDVELNKVCYRGKVENCQPYSFEKKGLCYAPHVKRDDRIVSNWNIEDKVIEGLWVTRVEFPSVKQIRRIREGFTYDNEIYLKEYRKIFSDHE